MKKTLSIAASIIVFCVALCAVTINGYIDIPVAGSDPIAPPSGKGRLYVNSLNQLTCVNPDSSTCLASGGAPSTANLISPESRILQGGTQGSAQGKQIAVAQGATQTLLNVTGSGYLTDFWWANNLGAGTSHTGIIIVTVDGTITFNGPAQLFFAANYATDAAASVFVNDFIQQGGGYKMAIPIPFSTSLRIGYLNNNAGGINLWWTMGYVTGVANNWGRYSHLNMAWGGQYASSVGVKSDTSIPLTQDQIGTLINVSSLSPGKLLGLYITWDSYGSTNNQTFLEGPITITLDGVTAYKTSGGEDYFGMADYFTAVSPGFGNRFQTLTLKTPNSLYAGVRFHIQEPMLFQNALGITAQAGLSSTGLTFTGTVHIAYMIWYYTS